jgi:hypothetical protein
VLEDKPAEVFRLQLADALPRPGLHPLRVIGPGLVEHESRPIRVADKAEGVARDAETALHFGAHRYILDVLP